MLGDSVYIYLLLAIIVQNFCTIFVMATLATRLEGIFDLLKKELFY